MSSLNGFGIFLLLLFFAAFAIGFNLLKNYIEDHKRMKEQLHKDDEITVLREDVLPFDIKSTPLRFGNIFITIYRLNPKKTGVENVNNIGLVYFKKLYKKSLIKDLMADKGGLNGN